MKVSKIIIITILIFTINNIYAQVDFSIETQEQRVSDEVKSKEVPDQSAVLYSSVEEIDKVLNEKMNRANELLAESDSLFQAGEYDKSYEISEQVKELATEIERLKLQKNCLLKIDEAKKLIKQAEDLEAQKYASDLLANAKSSLLLAQNSFESREWDSSLANSEESIRYANAAIDKINEIKRQEEEAKLAKKVEVPEVKEAPKEEKKPVIKGKYKIWKTYKVRLIPHRRDCLWRIAEYDFIYNNPWKWPIIYKANKSQIKDPDLIYPGQIFDIPELDKNGNPIMIEESETNKAEIHEQPPFQK